MYNRINDSSSFPWAAYHDSDETTQSAFDAYGRSFEDAFSGMHVTDPGSYGSSSASGSRSYFLASEPPVVELSRDEFLEKVEDFYGDEIHEIASNPQRYSAPIANKAARTAQVAYDSGRKGSEDARYFSYQLGEKSVGLLRTESGAPFKEVFKDKRARAKFERLFPGRKEITSTIDFRVVHPLVDNAGDILLEHQLRLDGDSPLLLSHPINESARNRAATLGFVDVSDSMMVLDPTRSDKWTNNSAGDWQRADKPPLYLAKTEESGGRHAESSARAANRTPDWEDDYDFM
ncbi:Effector protein NopP [Bradyrhizobium sp. DASA03076]|uniref:Effector protein NopP n=1 Tax=Bradyrhizobium manausense TaxID=989370 RepID=A0A0R3DII2_9BRAD|nr:hypothetical protein [Bradyrhizobium manausense]KRQ06479.1 hypothetical protein AOQ71_26065 [Bradyrhizobium manausense]